MRIRLALATLLLATPVTWAAAGIEHVILISVDGLRSDMLQTLLASDSSGQYAGFQRFVDEGAVTFNARTDYSYTKTLPNHTSMITGRPVLQPSGQPNTVHHGYTLNGTPQPWDTLHNRGNQNLPYVASVYDLVHDAGLKTALHASKSKFVVYDYSYDSDSGAADVTGADHGRDKIDRYVQKSTGSPSNASNMHADFLSDMATHRYHFSFVHYRDPDSTGHAKSWGSSSWNTSIARVSGYLQDIFALIDGDPQLRDHTAIILTSDHGGEGKGHNFEFRQENYIIPFFVWISGRVSPGDLYAWNGATRKNPGAGRPNHTSQPQPIRNGDAANLALQFLGFGPVPGSTINAAQDLRGPWTAQHQPLAGCGLNPADSLLVLAGSPALGTHMVLGVDNPLGTQFAGSVPLLMVSLGPDPAYPCGTRVSGAGMSGGDGELLVSMAPGDLVRPFFVGAPWTSAGTPSEYHFDLVDPALTGVKFYLQAWLVDSHPQSTRHFTLTSAVELTVGY